MHQMYSEYRIARYLATLPPDRFDAVVALSADLHFNQPPETIVSEVLAIRRAGRGVLTSGHNHNYTDGVYTVARGTWARSWGDSQSFAPWSRSSGSRVSTTREC